MFGSCHHQVKSIRRSFLAASTGSGALCQNVSTYLVNRLQEATQLFSNSQSTYLKSEQPLPPCSRQTIWNLTSSYVTEIKSREEKSQLIDFSAEDDAAAASSQADGFLGTDQRQTWSKNDVFLLEENTKMVEQREREIQSVVKSISDLNVIFKELAVMISEQVRIAF